MILLSICICTLKRRINYLNDLKAHLEKMVLAHPGEVEILIESDNGEITTGAKRNILYKKAQGLYVASVDDDDWVPSYYVEKILKAIQTRPDAVAINGIHLIDGRYSATWDISRFNPYMTAKLRGKLHHLRFHNHLSPIKREIAIQYPFPDVSFMEDYAFAKAMNDAEAIKTEVKIKEPMYEYRYRTVKKIKQ